MKRSLHIADPCSESWEAMPGTDARRFCGRCGKHVHSLSELSRPEAERLIASARAGELCVRVEHKGDGTVHFKREEQRGGRARPIVSAAAAASMLVASCSPAEPVITLELPAMVPDTTLDVGAAPAGAPDKEKNAEEDEACAPQNDAPPAAGLKGNEKGRAKAAGQDGQTDRRVTMGCLCAPGDTLCDCL
jgi:hypothetical protein